MKKGATIWLVAYAMLMLSYGALEMTHDFLHYLAAHHHSHIHDHDHDDHHHFHDHHPDTSHHEVSHHHHDEEETGMPSLINFFLFSQLKPAFVFNNFVSGHLLVVQARARSLHNIHPSTPPPEPTFC